jgi:glycosyltransferase involved in cell wall biosynthesis
VISVALPFRDAAETVGAALRSVLAEPEVGEVIAVDDGSLDAGAAVVSAIAASDRRVRVVRGPARGIVGALDTALSRCAGAYVARMDADDVSLPGRIRAAAKLLDRDASLGAVGTRVTVEGAAGGMAAYAAWQNGLITPDDHARELFVEAPLCHPSVVLRRAALDAVGAYRDTAWPEDWDLWLRLDAAGWGMAKVDEELLRWQHREGRLTFTHARYAWERLMDARAAYLPARLARVTAGRALAVWGAGPTGKALARALEGRGVRAARFVDIDPRKIGRTARGAPIVAADALDRTRDCCVVAVGARGARGLVRAHLAAHGWREGTDFIAAS